MSEIEVLFEDFGKWVFRPAVFLGIMLMLYAASYYSITAWEIFLALSFVAIIFLFVKVASRAMDARMAEARKRGIITEKDEFWAGVILLAVFLLRG